MTSEMVDVFDSHMNLMGVEEITAAHQKKMWHKVFHCWIINGNKVLFQLRSPQMVNYPDKLDISAAGHLQSGEEPWDGLREVEEELGITLTPENILGMEMIVWPHSYEFAYTCFAQIHVPLMQLKLQPDEVCGLFEISLSDMSALFNCRVESVIAKGILMDEKGQNQPVVRVIRLDDIAMHAVGYYLKIVDRFEKLLIQ